MPDLSIAASRQYWSDYDDPMIYRVITFMESIENWTLDGNPELEQAIEKLGEELDDIGKLDLSKLGHESYFISLACNIKSGRALRLLQAIDAIHPGSASRLLMNAEETSTSNEDTSGIFLRRNIVFERLRLLARVFSAERFKLVLRALEGEEANE
ncbi:MAG: type IVB secretion system protein IcmW [Gammaproteobacteria bacterium]